MVPVVELLNELWVVNSVHKSRDFKNLWARFELRAFILETLHEGTCGFTLALVYPSEINWILSALLPLGEV